MLKSKVYSLKGKVKKEIELPEVFSTVPRSDLIRKAFRAISLSLRQPYGASPLAGTRRVGHNSGPGRGAARIPRATSGSNNAVLLASFVGGRSAHAPRNTKNLHKGINEKERKMARSGAIAMTTSLESVQARGHRVPEGTTLPIIVENKLEEIKKTKDAREFLEAIGLYEDVQRSKDGIKVRAGRGKMRGRRYKQPKSLLIVGSSRDSLRAFSALPGVDIATPNSLSIRKLAPGGVGGRLAVFTEAAIESMRGGQ